MLQMYHLRRRLWLTFLLKSFALFVYTENAIWHLRQSLYSWLKGRILVIISDVEANSNGCTDFG